MKKLMLISPSFFSIEDGIIAGFEKEGYKVIRFDERMNNKKLNKIIIRLFPTLISRKMNKYYEELYSLIKEEEIDALMVIKAESMPEWFIKNIKENLTNITTMHYMYDPIENYPKILPKINHFDFAFTFDKKDSDKYGWILRPLYYPTSLDNVEEEIEYDASFVGTVHTDRTKVLENFINELHRRDQNNLYMYYYIPLRLMYYYQKYITRNFSNLKNDQYSTTPLTRKETDIILKKSKHILDVHHVAQSGLTSRTMETIGARRKLITTNPYVKEYDFYDEHNILIVDREKPVIPKGWLEKDYKEIPNDIMEIYTIKGFVRSFIDVIK